MNNLSEEEKKVIERIEDVFYQDLGKGINKFQKITLYEDSITDIRTILNLIENQQKEIEDWKFTAKYVEENYVSKERIKKDLKTCEQVYEREMKPYQREYGLDVTYLSKKEKEKLINTRNCLIVQMETYKQLLEE